MAYWQRKPGKNHPRVFVYYTSDGGVKTLPRSLTKPLDSKEDWEIDDWVEWYARVHSLPHAHPPRTTPGLDEIVEKWRLSLLDKGLHKATVRGKIGRLHMVLPVFATEPNMDAWYRRGHEVSEFLAAQPIPPERRRKCQQNFSEFYRWLQLTNRVAHRHLLMFETVRGGGGEDTPLKFTITPDEVLAFAKDRKGRSREMRLMALLGYFFSLRTGEIFAVTPESFLAGEATSAFECCKVMREIKLFHKLMLMVKETREPGGVIKKCPKNKPGGPVACFDKKAAKLIVEIVNESESGAPLISEFTPDYWTKKWRKEGFPNTKPKDMRRASIYWLGHYSKITLPGLKHHARHVNITTTEKYFRRPKEMFEEKRKGKLDLGA